MTRSKKTPRTPPKPGGGTESSAEAPQAHAMRETVESIVIAFVLAFLFRTFEAEAFVIPTGSMAPTLMGRHKDVECAKCGYRYRVTASEEGEETDFLKGKIRELQWDIRSTATEPAQQHNVAQMQNQLRQLLREIQDLAIVGGECPICHYAMPMRPELLGPAGPGDTGDVERQETFGGDRILVNKYLYTLTEPRRWDVVVFHYPGNAEQNFIKRLVGLPRETVRVFHGDLFIGGEAAERDDEFGIARKPPDKVRAMRQLVHDTEYDPVELYLAGWPLRWRKATDGNTGWQLDAQPVGDDVRQTFSIDATSGDESWLRYQHVVPDQEVWQAVSALPAGGANGQGAKLPGNLLAHGRRQLITDFNPYNTRVTRGQALHNVRQDEPPLRADALRRGVHWVGDLTLEVDVQVEATRGELILQLVEGGKNFNCRIDLASGNAALAIDGLADFDPTGKTPLAAPGDYRVTFANVDDQLLLWVKKKTWLNEQLAHDPELIEFDAETTYDADLVFGDRRRMRPQMSDLEPAAVAARAAKLRIARLRLWRDIYYIAAKWRPNRPNGLITDFESATHQLLERLPSEPDLWDEFLRRRHEDFRLGPDQYFVMGDNSPESSDARLWEQWPSQTGGRPSGPYLERKLLIGKAVVVYWPHAWYNIPLTRIPIWPNFKDMRLVR
jgi:signal peptidase I